MKFLIPLCILFSSLKASPLYYTFEGHVTSVNVDDIQVSVGDVAEYIFLVDHEQVGYYSPEKVLTPIPNTYYVDYLGGGPYYTLSSEHTYSWNYGNFNPDNGRITIQGSVDIDNSVSFLEVFAYTGPDWVVGQTYSGREFSTGVNSDYREILSTLVLTSVSDSPNSVPEPTSILMVLAGVLLLVAFTQGLGGHLKKPE